MIGCFLNIKHSVRCISVNIVVVSSNILTGTYSCIVPEYQATFCQVYMLGYCGNIQQHSDSFMLLDVVDNIQHYFVYMVSILKNHGE